MKINCTTCGGTGYVEHWHSSDTLCLMCDGQGEIEAAIDEYIESRDRDWWRRYYNQARETCEACLKRPMTLSDHKVLVKVMRAKRRHQMLGSAGVVGMHASMAIDDPVTWLPIWVYD